MNVLQYTPGAIFEQNPAKGGVCVVKDILFSSSAATNNQQVITAVTSKSIMVVSGNLRMTGGPGTATFKSGSGGTLKRAYNIPADTTADPNVYLPFDPAGHFSTDAGVGLYVDTTGATGITICLAYIEYVP